MIDCAFPETRIEKSVFHGTSHSTTPGSNTRASNEFIGNDFSTADFIDVGFRGGIDLSKQVLPNGRDYIYFADTCRAAEVAREIARLNSGSADAKQAESIQRLLEFHHANGQKQMLIRLTGQESLAEQFRAKLV